MEQLRQAFSQWWSQLDPSTRALPRYLWRAVVNFFEHGTRHAAALAYYTIFSIFPLSLLFIVGIGSVVGSAVAEAQVANALGIFLPSESALFLQENVSNALRQGTSFGLIALIGLVWSGLGLFSNVTSSLDLIFHVPTSRSLWRQRLMALVMIVMLIVLVTASFMTSLSMRLMAALLLDRASIWLSIGSYFVPLGLNMVIFLLLFRYVPARHVYWDAVWPAAIFGAIGWELAKTGFGWYLANLANYQFVYGSIATVIVLLFWAYILASVFLFSAELCAQLNSWFIAHQDSEDIPRVYLDLPTRNNPPVTENRRGEV
jgi:membrane protein